MGGGFIYKIILALFLLALAGNVTDRAEYFWTNHGKYFPGIMSLWPAFSAWTDFFFFFFFFFKHK